MAADRAVVWLLDGEHEVVRGCPADVLALVTAAAGDPAAFVHLERRYASSGGGMDTFADWHVRAAHVSSVGEHIGS